MKEDTKEISRIDSDGEVRKKKQYKCCFCEQYFDRSETTPFVENPRAKAQMATHRGRQVTTEAMATVQNPESVMLDVMNLILSYNDTSFEQIPDPQKCFKLVMDYGESGRLCDICKEVIFS